MNTCQLAYKCRLVLISLPLGVRIRICKNRLLRGFRTMTEVHLCVVCGL